MALRGAPSGARRGGVLLAVALALGLSLAAPAAHGVHAATGWLQTSGSVTYTPDIGRHLVHVTAEVTATNFREDSFETHNFFTDAPFYVQPQATNIRARS